MGPPADAPPGPASEVIASEVLASEVLASEVLASALLYLGVALAVGGLVVALRPSRARAAVHERRRRRGPAAALAAFGTGLATAGLLAPAGETVVTRPVAHIDTVVPRYQFGERHALAVAADPLAVDRAIRAVTADDIRLYRALTWLRRRGRHGPAGLLDAPAGVPMLELATRTGFHRLADAPGREIVLGVALPVSAAGRSCPPRRASSPRTPRRAAPSPATGA